MDFKNLSLDELILVVKSRISEFEENGLFCHRLVATGYLNLLLDIKEGKVDISIDSFEVIGYEDFI